MLKKLGIVLKQLMVESLGIWFYSVSKLPVGTHLQYFLKYRVKFPIDLIMDVGANNGKFSFSLIRHFPKAQFICIEPFEETFLMLSKKLKPSNFNLFKIALGENSETIQVTVNPQNQSDTNSLQNVSTGDSNLKTESITVISLDEFMTHNGIQRVDFLKIDTEGFDLKVLKGGIQNLKAGNIKLILVESGLDPQNNYHVLFNEILSFLIAREFAFVGFFQTDIRKISKRMHFSNALFAHSSILNKIK